MIGVHCSPCLYLKFYQLKICLIIIYISFYRFIYHNLVLILSLSSIDFITYQLQFELQKSKFCVLNSNDWMFLSEIISIR